MKRALISGVTGQDGSILADFLLGKGYEVHGLVRRSSSFNTGRIDRIHGDEAEAGCRMFLHYGDMTDGLSLLRVLEKTQPDEIYNLAAQSHVAVSFETPEYTHETIATGTLKLLETVRLLGMRPRIYQAGTSEMFGASPPPQNEETPFRPRSPYGIAKLAAHWTAVMYREAHGMHVSNGILFNHESAVRGENFVTRKVCAHAARWLKGDRTPLRLGNLDARRDWGHALDYVEGMWRMLQQDEPGDYVLATGEAHTVLELVELAFREIGLKLWVDRYNGEIAALRPDGDPCLAVIVDKRHFRPLEVDRLRGDASKAKRILGWEPKIKFDGLIRSMVQAELAALGGDPRHA